jgi:hypothetical protein
MSGKTNQIIKLLKDGYSYQYIQAQLEVSPSTISKAKKSMEEFEDSTICSDSDSTKVADGIDKNDLYGPETDTPTPNSGSSSAINSEDPAIVLKMKELELAHERFLKNMEMAEKEKERIFEREKRENELKEMRIRNKESIENNKLKERIEELESKLEMMQEDQYDYDEEPEKEEEEIDDSGFYDSYYEMIQTIINSDEQKWNEEEANQAYSEVKALRKTFKEIHGKEKDIFEEWEILNLIKDVLSDMKQKFEDSYFNYVKIRLRLSQEQLDKLNEANIPE